MADRGSRMAFPRLDRRLAPALLLALVALAAPSASAQSQSRVVRDGTLGSGPLEVGPGQGATYLITPEMGEQHGGNLFHSFKRFGIGKDETATFIGPESVSNVISRVTGGELSEIDGTLRSTIPGADVWLLNPSGVVFGEGATLDVQGSFHAATADFVGFQGSDDRFYADRARTSVLSTAPPAAFGFLPGSHGAPVRVDRSQLEVPDGETLELVGGDLTLTGAEVLAPGGEVRLEAPMKVELSQSLVDVGREGDAPGSISIRGGQIVIEDHSKVLAENESPVPGDPAVPGPGWISIEAGESVLVDHSLLSVNTSSAGNAGKIHVGGLAEDRPSPDVTLRNGPGYFHDFRDPTDPRNQPHPVEVGLDAGTSSGGQGGRIEIDARSLEIKNGVDVRVVTTGGIEGRTATGNAGSIDIKADSMDALDRSSLDAGILGKSEGDAGTIEIDLRGRLRIDGSPTDGSAREPDAVSHASIV